MAEETKIKKIKKASEDKATEKNIVETKPVEPVDATDIVETKSEEKKVVKKVEVTPKDKAIVNGYSIRISPKYSKYVCRMITGKSIIRAKEMLEGVILEKFPVKMTALEVPHQKGKGISGAKYPKDTAKGILLLVKQLESNCNVNQIENPVIKIAMPNRASEPARRAGRHGKRTHLYLEAVSKESFLKNKLNKNKK